MSEQKPRCADRIFSGGRSHQCSRAGVVEENGKLWCKQHAPSSEKARRDARDKKWAAEAQVRAAGYAIDSARLDCAEAAKRAVLQQGSWDAVADATGELIKAEAAKAEARDALAKLLGKGDA